MQLLVGGSWNNPLTIQANERITTDRDVHLNAISAAFFSTLRARIVAGRDFDERDARPLGGPAPARRLSTRPLPTDTSRGVARSALVYASGAGPDAKPDIEIVGVVADFSYRGLREESKQAYFPIVEGAVTNGNFYVWVRGTPEKAFQQIRTLIHNADPALPIIYLRTLDEQVGRSLNTERMLAAQSGGFGTMALLLSFVGLYGVMSYVVTRRTREIGIRLVLGATRSSALGLVLRDALTMITAGTAIALSCV